ncbi:Uncharacterised protein [Bordetella pertussis]|nr:Uncharacterised protein [Bordetella pertussis]
MPALESGAMMAQAACASLRSLPEENSIAPGWKAAIWLSSRSVVMKHCAVNVPGTTWMRDTSMPSPDRRARYSPASSPTVATGTGWPPSSLRL